MGHIQSIATTNSGTIRCCIAKSDSYYRTTDRFAPWGTYGTYGTNLFISSGSRTINLKDSGSSIVLTHEGVTTRLDQYNQPHTVHTIGILLNDGSINVWTYSVDCEGVLELGFYRDDDKKEVYIMVVRSGYPYTTYWIGLENMGQAALRSSGVSKLVYNWLNGVPTSSDPYSDEHNQPTGGDGDHDVSSDIIEIPDVPELTAINSELITAYSPTVGQIQQFGNYLWSEGFNIESLKKIFNDPWEGILGLSVVPVTPPIGANRLVKLGNLETNVSMPRIISQFVTVECGSVTVNRFLGSYLDYSPYTKVEIYLPYIGTRSLDTDTVMNRTLTVTYQVDILSGSCVCFIKVNGSVMYEFSGCCSAQFPITANNYASVISSALSVATSAIGTAVSVSSGNVAGAIGGIASTASSVMGMKEHVEKGGNVSGTSGLMSVQKPYLIISYPNKCVPDNQNEFMGYPSYKTVVLGELSGYTEIDTIHLDNIIATEDEKTEIETILKSGVIL